MLKQKAFSLELTLCVIAICVIVITVGYYSIVDANKYAALRQKDFMDVPVNTPALVDDNLCAAAVGGNATSYSTLSPVASTSTIPTTSPIYVSTNTSMPNAAAAATASGSTFSTTPMPTSYNVESQYDISSVLLYEPTLSYSDFCSLDQQDYTSLINDSNLSFANKALFQRFHNACPNNNKSVKLMSNAANAVSSSSSVVNQGKTAASNIMQNSNPVIAQKNYISQEAPNIGY